MTDRKDGADEPEGFDWLYGTSNKGVGSDQPTDQPTEQIIDGPRSTRQPSRDTEPTQVFQRPVGATPYQRPTGGSRRPDDAPPTIAPTPGGPPDKPSKRRGFGGRRWRFGPGRAVVLVLVLWVAYLLAVPIFAWNTVSRVDADPSGGRPGDQPGTTYLLVGSDSRKGLTKKQRKELHTGGDVGQRTDTIMLLHTGDGPNLLMSIPRDSLVNVPGHGTTKINAAYAFGGPQLLVKTIENATKIRVDDYVEIGFGGFVNLVNAVGGITICPKTAMNDKDANLHVKAGCQDADGRKALAYSRSRHAQKLGDIDRAAHQREVVSQVGSKAFAASTFLNPVKYWKLNFGGAESVAVGRDVSAKSFANFVLAMRSVSGDKGLTCGVPIRDFAVHWDEQRSEQMFKLIRQDHTDKISKSLCLPAGIER
jgi:LCP family protein required for cell wall assembly